VAIVFLALNGVGLGHLVRASVVCEVLADEGERPVIFSQGLFPLDDRSRFPGRTVPSLWRASEAVRLEVSSDIVSMARITLPSVVLEDTHPNPLTLPRGVRRVLVVRPPNFSYLQELENHYGRTFERFLLADSPRSPTWPYTPAETEALSRWPKWSSVDPIYRRARASDVAVVRRRYRVDDRPLCLFSMGGGGRQYPDGSDAPRFAASASRAADTIQALDPRARFLFVRGPYFPDDFDVDDRFETVDPEPLMPALVTLARLAVVRSGFNTMWECIAAGVPFVPVIGNTFEEPQDARLDGLRAAGLLSGDVATSWADERWRARYAAAAREVAARYPGRPDAAALRRAVLGQVRSVRMARAPSGAATPTRRRRRAGRRTGAATDGQARRPLTIRVDDVAVPEMTLGWLLGELAGRGLRASLEVIPYLNVLDEPRLARFDRRAELFEVAQHGYAHVPRADADRRSYEFSPAASAATDAELDDLAAGRAQLATTFPARFSGGFSPPFDAFPPWLPDAWRALGGAFVSQMRPAPPAPAVPCASAGVDVWDWGHDRPRGLNAIGRALSAHVAEHGYGGVVLHPHRLRSRAARHHLTLLLDLLTERGFYGVSLRAVALDAALAAR
jgi:hypothetical protein